MRDGVPARYRGCGVESPAGRAGAAGVTARGAGSGSLPVHVEPQPTSVALPSAACSPSDYGPWSTPPPTCPTASGRPATPSIWWVARSVTPSWPGSTRYRPTVTHDLDFTTDARPDDIEALLRGWADAVWTQGKRFGTIACLRGDQKYEITTHRAEAYHPDSRKPDVAFGDSIEDDLARRDFTDQRHGATSARTRVDRPVRRPRRPGGAAAAHPARPRGLVRRRPVAHAAGGPLHGPARPRAHRGAGGGRPGRPRPALDRVGRADPRRARQDHGGPGPLHRPVVRGPHRSGRRVPARAARPGAGAGPDPPAQGRAGPHPGRGGQDVARPAAAVGRPLP